MPNWHRNVETGSRVIRYIFYTPPNAIFISTVTVITSLLFGFAGLGLSNGLILFGLPALLGGFIASYLTGFKTGTTMLVAFASSLFAGIFSIAGVHAALFSYILLFAYQHTVYTILKGETPTRAVLPPAVQPLSGIIFAYILYPQIFVAILIVKIVALLVILSVAGFIIFHSIDNPMRKSLGFGLNDLAKYYIKALSLDDDIGIDELISGEPMDTRVDVLAFRSDNGIKAALVSTEIHPGLMKGVGSHNLPEKVTTKLKDIAHTIVVKGASTHEQDPTKDVSDGFANIVRKLIGKMHYSDSVTDFVPAVYGNARVTAQIAGNAVFLYSTFAPDPTDDVDIAIGREMREIAREMKLDVFYVDCHNCHGVDAMIRPDTEQATNLLNASREVFRKAFAEGRKKLKVGLAHRAYATVFVLEVFPEGKRKVFVFFDKNNIIVEARNKVIEFLCGTGEINPEDLEIFTSDCHCTIDLMHIHNPMKVEDVANLKIPLREMYDEAVADMEEIEVGFASEMMNVQVLGTKIKQMQDFAKGRAKAARVLHGPLTVAAHVLAVVIWFLS